MITIPQPIKYDKDIHFNDRITKPLDPNNDLLFIKRVLEDLEKDEAEAYLVSYGGKVAVCRKGLTPAISCHGERRHNYFALKNNKSGNMIVAGKNSRRPESLLAVIKNIVKTSPSKLYLLKRKRELSIADRCQLVGYTLLKQEIPFK